MIIAFSMHVSDTTVLLAGSAFSDNTANSTGYLFTVLHYIILYYIILYYIILYYIILYYIILYFMHVACSVTVTFLYVFIFDQGILNLITSSLVLEQ
jgi:hypothetical protein